MTLICLGGFALKCGKVLFIVVQYSLRNRPLKIMGLRENSAREGDTCFTPLARVSLSRACSFVRPNTFKRLLHRLRSQRRCCLTSSPGRFSLALEVGLAPPPKPGKGALGTRLDVVDKNRQQSVVSFFFSFLLPMPYTPKALIKTIVKSKVVRSP